MRGGFAKRGRHVDPGSKPRVGIIGAGVAGLRCADVLLSHGFDVTVIEGRDRVGGRVHQMQLPDGHLVDMGPNWIHGTKCNPISELAEQTGTVLADLDHAANVLDESGTLVETGAAEECSTVMWDIVQDAFLLSKKSCADIDRSRSLWDFFCERLPDRMPETDPKFEDKRKLVLQMSELWGAYVGSPIQTQSLKFFWLEECLEGETLFCASTYRKILDAIAKPAVENAEIRLNTVVQTIRYQQAAAGNNSSVQIRTSSGEIISFDEVVVTAPLGWLKRNLDAFEPALPPRLVEAVNSIGYGCLEKVFITFPKAFWRPHTAGESKVQGFVQWLSPNYAAATNPEQWIQEGVELASLSPPSSHPTLLFYIYGAQSHHIVSALASLPSKAAEAEVLLDFFKPYYSRLPHYSETAPECRPTGCVATSWLRDELAGNGSYSNFQVGLERGDEDICTVRRGLPDAGLWFAGEHTAPFVGLGTTTGAYWSGESAGQRIAEAYGLTKGEEEARETSSE